MELLSKGLQTYFFSDGVKLSVKAQTLYAILQKSVGFVC